MQLPSRHGPERLRSALRKTGAVIRIRRLPPRIPVGKVYELEYRPEGNPEEGWHGVTREPIEYLAPVLGEDRSRVAVAEADREWIRGSTHWAVERDEHRVGEDEGWSVHWGPPVTAVVPRVGWWWLITHLLLLILGVWAYLDAVANADPAADGMDVGIGYIISVFPLGLPWSVAVFFALSASTASLEDPLLLTLGIGPGVLNLVLHALYRWRRARNMRDLRSRT